MLPLAVPDSGWLDWRKGRQFLRQPRNFREPGIARRVYVIDESPFLGFFGGHELVTVQCALDLLVTSSAMFRIQRVQAPLGLQNVFGMALDIRSETLEAAGNLVDHD